MQLLAADLAQVVAVTHVDRDTAPQIREPERRDAVAAVRRSEQCKESLVLVDRQLLPGAERISLRRVVERDRNDRAEVGISQRGPGLPGAG